MPQVLFIWFLIAIFLLFSPLQDRNPPENTIKLCQFQANGLLFTGIIGPDSFLMYDDRSGKKIELLTAGTPFSLSKGGEEVNFDFEVKKESNYIYNFNISFKEEYRSNVLRLTGNNAQSKYIDYGVPLSFYIRVTKKGENISIMDKIESKTYYSGTGFDYMYRQSVISKRISDVKLYPGRYNVYVKNMLPTQEYDKYKLYIGISDQLLN